MIGYHGAAELDIQVVALPAVTVAIGFGENELVVEDAAGRRALGGFVSGIRGGAMRVRGSGIECVEVRLSPVRAYSVLGVAPTDVGSAVIGLEDLWGPGALRLRERLADAVTWQERFVMTKSFLSQSGSVGRAPDPEVAASWNRILAHRP